jgi:hypothetical protein
MHMFISYYWRICSYVLHLGTLFLYSKFESHHTIHMYGMVLLLFEQYVSCDTLALASISVPCCSWSVRTPFLHAPPNSVVGHFCFCSIGTTNLFFLIWQPPLLSFSISWLFVQCHCSYLDSICHVIVFCLLHLWRPVKPIKSLFFSILLYSWLCCFWFSSFLTSILLAFTPSVLCHHFHTTSYSNTLSIFHSTRGMIFSSRSLLYKL